MGKNKKVIAIAGNPNCGKTTLFNALTGGNQRIGNWPGVTVEKKVGECCIGKTKVDVVDLPGIYSLSSSSLDEEISRDFIIQESPDLLINILDASNIERNMYLTTQLLDMRVPMVVVLNMMDRVKKKSIKINVGKLASLLQCPVIPVVANKNKGISTLLSEVRNVLDVKRISNVEVTYPSELNEAASNIEDELNERLYAAKYEKKWLSIKLLEDDILIKAAEKDYVLQNLIKKERQKIEKIIGEEADVVIAESRYGFINSVCKSVVDRTNVIRKNISDFIDRIVLNRVFGIPIFLFAMYLTFWITINLGGAFIDFFDIFAGTVFVDGVGHFLLMIGIPEFIRVFVADGIGGGIQTVATFIPPVFFMFLCLAVLEDSGYMARAAFVMDRFMRMIGLPGKAFVPMLVGFGCNVPAIMATRTLENERDRITTIMMNPFMSCGARLPVYALFAAAFFPQSGGNVVFALYMIGIFLAIFTGYLFKTTLLKGEVSSFIMELPPYHIPKLKTVFIHTWGRVRTFMFRAGKAILLVIIILNILNSLGTDGSFGNSDTEKSVLSSIGKVIVPVFSPMGMKEENWPAAVGIFTGIFAKEMVVGTLDTLYSQMDIEEAGSEMSEEEFDFIGGIKESFATIPDALFGLELPFSVSGLIGSDVNGAIEELEVETSTYSILRSKFDGRVGAFAYLLMILLYMPCVAAIAAVYRELNLAWMVFSCVYLSGLAWVCSTTFYQIMRFGAHPVGSSLWLCVCAGFIGGLIVFLKTKGREVLIVG